MEDKNKSDDENIVEVTAAGGVLFRREQDDTPEVLLIFRRGVWDLPKGKKEGGETVRECAVREVAEEVGSSLPQIHAKLTETFHDYHENETHYGKHTHWFAMSIDDEAEDELEPENDEGIEQLQWMRLDKAMSTVGYDNLVKVLQKFEQWYYLG